MIPGRVPFDSGNTGFRTTPGTRISAEFGNSEFRVIPGSVPVDSGKPDFRVTTETNSSGCPCQPVVPGLLREPGVPGYSVNPDFLVTL